MRTRKRSKQTDSSLGFGTRATLNTSRDTLLEAIGLQPRALPFFSLFFSLPSLFLTFLLVFGVASVRSTVSTHVDLPIESCECR